MALSDAEFSRIRNRCDSLEDGPDYRCQNYLENLLNTVLDFQMPSPVVEKATRYFFNAHGITTHDQLRSLIDRFPDTKSGNLELAKCLWNYNLWTRAKFLRRIMECFEERGIRNQENLEKWVQKADFERDVKGQFRTEEHSIGYTLFKWLQLRLGIDTIKPDVHILSFVADSIGRPISPDEAVSALTRIAMETNRKAFRLDAAIWTHQRNLKSEPEVIKDAIDYRAYFKEWKDLNIFEDRIDGINGVYAFKLNIEFGRLIGQSSILYIGKADQNAERNKRPGIWHRLQNYRQNNAGASKRLKEIKEIFGESAIMYSYVVCDNPREVEKRLLDHYYELHKEFPPLNRQA